MSDGAPFSPSEDLAYLLGVICGDVCLSWLPRTFQVAISCDTPYLDLLETYQRFLENMRSGSFER